MRTFDLVRRLCLAAPIALVVASARGAGDDFAFTLLHNNDAESRLISVRSTQPDFGGVARFATVVANARAAAGQGNSLLVTSGDNVLAGPEWDCGTRNGVPFLDSIALTEIGYDAICLGNHEFDFGPDVLAELIEGVGNGIPFLSANLDVSPVPSLAAVAVAGRFAGAAVFEVGGRQIGVVGATTPALPYLSSPGAVIVDADVRAAVQSAIDELLASGVGIIVLTSHMQNIGESVELISTLSGVDIAIAADGADLLANPGTPLLPGDEPAGPYPKLAADADGRIVPVVATADGYSYLGRLSVTFDAAGELVSIDPTSGPIRVLGGDAPDAVDGDPVVEATVFEPVFECVSGLAESLVAQSEVPLDGIRQNVRSRETNEGNLIADALLEAAANIAKSSGVPVPDVALMNGGGIRNDSILPAGGISELDTYLMLPFVNFITVVPEVPVARFKELLENAVSRVAVPAGYPDSGTGRFAQVSGCRFTFNVDLPPGSRVRGVILSSGSVIVSNGVPVEGAAPISIVLPDILARGGDEYPLADLPFVNLGVTCQRALVEYLEVGLGGEITAEMYPVEGQGRIVRLEDPADLNDDSRIDAADLAMLLGWWGPCRPKGDCAADLDHDGVVGPSDVTILLASWTL
ncbi:MAG: 5'-nucleotidase C-terminal domain-containing protein [Phycisphaerales bacterium]